jgi:transposase
MRYPAVEKREIIRLVEQSALPARRTMAHLGILRSTFYRWCEQFRAGGPEALADKPSRPARVWNRIPDEIRSRIVDLALAETELSRLHGAWARPRPQSAPPSPSPSPSPSPRVPGPRWPPTPR